jgi:galactonate dehydratase
LLTYLQRVDERPRLLVKIILHFCAAQPSFKILEYKLHDKVRWAVDPYRPKDGYLELRRDRPGRGIEIGESALCTDDYVHWKCTLPIRPDGSTAYV